MDVDANLVRAIRGPITLITLGVLFTLDHFTPFGFSQTWPVLLIVFGLLSLLRRSARQSSRPGDPPWGGPPGTPPWGGPPGSPPWGGPPGTPPWTPPQPSSSGPGSSGGGGYRQSPYGNSGQTPSGSGAPGGGGAR